MSAGSLNSLVRIRCGMSKYLIPLFLVILSWTATASNAAGPSFPSQLTQIPAPTGDYALTWKRGALEEGKPHQLFLKNLSTGHVLKILEFQRQVDVLWAPNGRFVAVTDWIGSNVSEVLLFQPGNKKVRNLADCLYDSLGEQPELSHSIHSYFEAVSWNGSRKLLFRVFGDTSDNEASDLRPFEHYFEFDISGAVRKAEPESGK